MVTNDYYDREIVLIKYIIKLKTNLLEKSNRFVFILISNNLF